MGDGLLCNNTQIHNTAALEQCERSVHAQCERTHGAQALRVI